MFEKWTEEDKQSLIDTIIWYRDHYHKNCADEHNELIESIKKTDDPELLTWYDRIVDGWIDY